MRLISKPVHSHHLISSLPIFPMSSNSQWNLTSLGSKPLFRHLLVLQSQVHWLSWCLVSFLQSPRWCKQSHLPGSSLCSGHSMDFGEESPQFKSWLCHLAASGLYLSHRSPQGRWEWKDIMQRTWPILVAVTKVVPSHLHHPVPTCNLLLHWIRASLLWAREFEEGDGMWLPRVVKKGHCSFRSTLSARLPTQDPLNSSSSPLSPLLFAEVLAALKRQTMTRPSPGSLSHPELAPPPFVCFRACSGLIWLQSKQRAPQ